MIIAIPEALREKLGPEGARALADLLNEASVQTRGDVIEIAALLGILFAFFRP